MSLGESEVGTSCLRVRGGASSVWTPAARPSGCPPRPFSLPLLARMRALCALSVRARCDFAASVPSASALDPHSLVTCPNPLLCSSRVSVRINSAGLSLSPRQCADVYDANGCCWASCRWHNLVRTPRARQRRWAGFTSSTALTFQRSPPFGCIIASAYAQSPSGTRTA